MKYRTVEKPARVEQTIKKSKFIGTVKPVESVEEAKNFIEEVSSEFRKATHNVWAYRVGVGESAEFMYSDDREPSKSAGLPTFNAIKSADITNCAVVITRFFGGIKLGIGGLIRAYNSTAKAAIEEAGIIEVNLKKNIILSFPYDEIRLVMYFVHRFNGVVINEEYSKNVKLTVAIDEELIEQFVNAIKGKTNRVIFL